jgi:hypothetical protein
MARGGARPNSGPKPRALRYARDVAAAERKIMLALPSVIDGLIAAAESGDVAAGRYIVDRALGRMDGTKPPIADRIFSDEGADDGE